MTDKALAERLRKLAQAYRSVVVVDVTSINEATDLDRAADLIESMAQQSGRHVALVCPQCSWTLERREPLSEEQIERVRDNCVVTPAEFAGRRYGWAINFARAIEQAHGIRSEK